MAAVPGVPTDSISPSGHIDFSADPWPNILQQCAMTANKTNRANALASGPPATHVAVSRTWFATFAPTWNSIVSEGRKAQSMIIASRGTPQVPCEPLCAKADNSRPFRDCLVINPGHFSGACANCQIRDWRARCTHNREPTP